MNSSQLPNSRLTSTFRAVPKAASAIVILVGSLVLIGWMLDIPTLKSILPSWVTMKANTALAFVFSSLSLWLLHEEGKRQEARGRRGNNQFISSRHRIGQVLAGTVAIIGLLTLSQYLFNWNLGIDQLVFRESSGAVGTSHLGRMAPTTALNFCLIGFALVLLDQRTRRDNCPFQFLTLTAALVSLQPLLGYAYGLESLYGIASYTQMALHTVLTFVVLCLGILSARPDSGVMRIVTNNNTSGFIARRLLLTAIAIPSVLGWLIVQGYRLGLYNTAFGLSILIMVSIVVFAVWILQNAQILDRLDTKGYSAQQALRESEERYRAFIEQSSEGIWRFELEQPLSPDCPVDQQIQHFYQYGYLAECNNVMAQMYGFSEAQEIVGVRLKDFLVPNDPHNIEYLGAFIQSGYRLNDAESHEVDKEGNAKYFLNNLVGIIENGLLLRAWGTQRDITERKRTESALKESQERFRKFFEEAPIGISVVDLDGRFLKVNKTFCKMLGYLEEELHQLTFAAITHPEDVEKDLGYAEQLFKCDIPSYQFEKRYIKRNGEILWINLTATVICEEDGKACYGLGMVEDITQRKQNQEALQETNQTLQALIQACPLAITVFSLDDGKVKMWNPAAENIFGWSEQEALGRFLPSVPEDKQDEFLENLDWVRQGNALTGVETRRQKRGGSPIDISVWAAPLCDARGNVSCMSIVADISDRKQAEVALKESEERFRKLAEKVRVIPWEADATTWKFTYVGPQTVEILGYPLSDWYIDNFWAQHIHPEDRDWAINYCLESSAVLDNYEFEYRMFAADGRVVWLYDIVNVVRSEAGLSVLRGFMIDITQRKRLEEEREQLLVREQAARAASEAARSEAEEANRMKDEFLATLSHELRTPLNAMLGWTQMLRTRKLNEATAGRALETIDRNTKSLAALIEDVLDVSGIIKGKLHLNIAPVELVPVIEAAINTVSPAARLKEIQIESIVDYSVEPILGDANRLQQVVWNLLSNAVKFTPQGGRVEVRLERIDRLASWRVGEELQVEGLNQPLNLPYPSGNGNTFGEPPSTLQPPNLQLPNPCVQISVSDTGKGIAPDFLPYVFDRFRQENSSTTRSYGGLGLGLAIARHLVELHGGTIYATSPGERKGATFSVQLPLISVHTQASNQLAVNSTSEENQRLC